MVDDHALGVVARADDLDRLDRALGGQLGRGGRSGTRVHAPNAEPEPGPGAGRTVLLLSRMGGLSRLIGGEANRRIRRPVYARPPPIANEIAADRAIVARGDPNQNKASATGKTSISIAKGTTMRTQSGRAVRSMRRAGSDRRAAWPVVLTVAAAAGIRAGPD